LCKFKAIELSYTISEASMLIILQKAKFGQNSYLNQLTDRKLADLIQHLHTTEVEVGKV